MTAPLSHSGAALIALMLTAKRPSCPGRTGLRGVDIRPRPFNEFDQTILETQAGRPQAHRSRGVVRGLGRRVPGSVMRRYKCRRILFETNPSRLAPCRGLALSHPMADAGPLALLDHRCPKSRPRRQASRRGGTICYCPNRRLGGG